MIELQKIGTEIIADFRYGVQGQGGDWVGIGCVKGKFIIQKKGGWNYNSTPLHLE